MCTSNNVFSHNILNIYNKWQQLAYQMLLFKYIFILNILICLITTLYNKNNHLANYISMEKKKSQLALESLPLDKDNILKSINSILSEIINENNDNSKAKLIEIQKNTSFFAKKIPSISVLSYLERIIKYTKMEEATLIVLLIYIDRLCESNSFLLTENNIHRYVVNSLYLESLSPLLF